MESRIPTSEKERLEAACSLFFLKKKQREIAMDLVSKPKNGYKMGPYQLIRRVVTPIIGVVIPVTHL